MKEDLLSYNKFRSGAAWIILLLGIGLYALGYFFCDKDDIWKQIVIKLGDVLVIGVILGYLSNAARFLGVFKSDLEDIVYGKEFIKRRNDLPILWDTISKQMIKEKFPAISKDLLAVIKDNYLPISSPIYYNDYHIMEELSWADEEKKFIKVTETINFEIITESESEFELPMSTWLDVEGLEKGQYSVSIKEFLVNGKSATTTIEEKYGNGSYEHHCKAILSGSKKYEIEQKREKIYSLEKDYDISFRARYIVNKLEVELKYPENDLDVNFITRGTTKDFKDVHASSGLVSKQYKGIILPRQGYIFTLNKK